MVFIPYQADVVMHRLPIANWVLIGATVLVSVLGFFSPPLAEQMLLDGWQLPGLLGHMFIHADPSHLVGNMVFLFVFGNGICAKVGNLWYPLVYLGVGLIAAIAQLLLDGDPALGASGAINGIVGMFLVYYPINEIRIRWWLAIWYTGTFEVSSVWMILLWFGFDLWGSYSGAGGAAYMAHLGGFIAGFGLASLLLLTGLVETDECERSIYEAIKRGE